MIISKIKDSGRTVHRKRAGIRNRSGGALSQRPVRNKCRAGISVGAGKRPSACVVLGQCAGTRGNRPADHAIARTFKRKILVHCGDCIGRIECERARIRLDR